MIPNKITAARAALGSALNPDFLLKEESSLVFLIGEEKRMH